MDNRVYTIPFSGPGTDSVGNPIQPSTEPGPLDGFFAGDENRLAVVAIESFVGALATGGMNAFNPLVFYGPPGSGKSHLAHGAAHTGRDLLGKSPVVCLPAVEFAQALRDAIEIEAVDQWRSDIRRVRLMVIEDLDQLVEKLSAEQELARTFDELIAGGGQVLVTMKEPPHATPGLLPCLTGRLSAGLAVGLSLPERDTRRRLVSRMAASRDMNVSDAALEVLADRLAVSVRELTGAMNHLRLSVSGRIDTEHARRFVAGAMQQRMPQIREIASRTARHYSLKVADLRSHSRGRSLVTARGVAMLLARQLTDKSLRQIGDYFGGRDHTTVLHACRRTKKLVESHSATEQSTNQLRQSLAGT